MPSGRSFGMSGAAALKALAPAADPRRGTDCDPPYVVIAGSYDHMSSARYASILVARTLNVIFAILKSIQNIFDIQCSDLSDVVSTKYMGVDASQGVLHHLVLRYFSSDYPE